MSPINGLTERRRLPRLGKIHLGIKVRTNVQCKCKKKNGKINPKCRLCKGTGFIYRPEETDYFVCPPEVQKEFGKQPKELKIMFPLADSEVFFQQWYKYYGPEYLKCIGDGINAKTWDLEKGDLKTIECPCKKLEKNECKAIGILQFLLPDIPGAGVWQISTSSKNSIVDLNSAIDYIRRLCGRIEMMPLVLKRVETKTQRIEKGVPRGGIHYTLQIDLDNVSLRELQQAAQTPRERVFLPSPDDTKDDLLYSDTGYEPTEKQKEQIKKDSEAKKVMDEETANAEVVPKEETTDVPSPAKTTTEEEQIEAVCAEFESKLEDKIDYYKTLGGKVTDRAKELMGDIKKMKPKVRKQELERWINFYAEQIELIKKKTTSKNESTEEDIGSAPWDEERQQKLPEK